MILYGGDRQARAHGYSALSSTYYSIVGTALAQLRAILRSERFALFIPIRTAGWLLTWFPLAVWCSWRMLTFSSRVVTLIGYDGMSANQCDIRQSILRRRERYDEAKRCIFAGLAKNPEKATRGLLHVGLADILWREGKQRDAKSKITSACFAAMEAEEQDPLQAARIYRHCADVIGRSSYLNDVYEERWFRGRARWIINAFGAKDQLLKLQQEVF